MDKLKNYLLATGCLVTLVAALVLSVNVWAQEQLDKSSSLTIEKDSRTDSWTAICETSVSGIDPHEIYGGRLFLQFDPYDRVGETITVIDATWDVDPENRTWTDSSPGDYMFRAKLRGRAVTLLAEVNLDRFTFLNNDQVHYDTSIVLGTWGSGTNLFYANHSAGVFVSP